ncbi:MAG TPA: glucose 1-dehydrogenase [Burkholderiales bacterium]|nr:glucose 1-dehydrogenase [Burkholderiales bacterium]
MGNGENGRPVALVTGASYGIGAASALALARQGYDVALTATRAENLAQSVADVRACGARAVAVALDLRSTESIERAVAEVVRSMGRIDVLVNNAGTTAGSRALDVTPDEWRTIMDTNLTGTFFVTQQVGRHMVDAKRQGCVISITSTHGMIGAPGRAPYGISKAAVIQMTRMLAIEWAEYGIRVNSVAPGRVDTPSPLRAAHSSDPKYMAAVVNKIPLKRVATSEDVAGAVAYLASPAASYITGQTLVLDGGLTSY